MIEAKIVYTYNGKHYDLKELNWGGSTGTKPPTAPPTRSKW
jgi:hypothetical protein